MKFIHPGDKLDTLEPLPTPKKIIMRFEWFTIYELDGWRLWLQIDGGEGMEFQKSELMGFLANLWKRF